MSSARRAFEVSAIMIERVRKEGACDAVRQDIKANFGLELSEDVIFQIMACGGVVVLMHMGKAMSAGVLSVDSDRLRELQAEEAAERGAPKSSEPDENINLDAERAAREAIERIKKLH